MEKHHDGRTLADRASEEIIQLILEKDMKEGDRLPSEYELAHLLAVGRSTLREAIKRLVSRNILKVQQGAGTFVSNRTGVTEDPLGLTFIGNDPAVALDLLDVRLMLEPEMCAVVAERATAEQIKNMRACCDKVSSLIKENLDFSDADVQFHRYLAECSGNQVLSNLVSVITPAISIVVANTKEGRWLITDIQHHQIVDAIERHDSAGARYNMIAHLNASREVIIKNLTT